MSWESDERDAAQAKLDAIRERCVGYTPSPDVVDEILAIIDGAGVAATGPLTVSEQAVFDVMLARYRTHGSPS